MKEEKFNDNTLNEFSDAVEKFIEGYDTEKNHAHIFCVIAEENGKDMQITSYIKGALLQIASVIDSVITSDERLKTATLIHRLLELGEIKKDKENTDKTLDILKNLVK